MKKSPIVTVNGTQWERIPIVTHKIMLGEDMVELIKSYAGSKLKPKDILCLSQKVVAISAKNVVHISQVKAGWLAKFITRYVTKWPNDIGFERPEKMQVAINQAGYPRMLLAVAVGGVTRLFGRRGDFYRIAGNKISEIDGFNPKAMAPFNEYAMIPVKDENAVCQKIEDTLGHSTYIIDGNNINVKVVGMSKGFAGLGVTQGELREIMLDNPMGQDDELTPIFIIRRV